MAAYRRFVAYVYRYQNGRKGDNCGFVKVEARNGLCTFFLRLQGVDFSDQARVFAFARTEDGADFLPLGIAAIKDGVLHQRLDADRLHMGGSGYTLEQCGGLICTGESDCYYGTVWDRYDTVPKWEKEMTEPAPGQMSEARNREKIEEKEKAERADCEESREREKAEQPDREESREREKAEQPDCEESRERDKTEESVHEDSGDAEKIKPSEEWKKEPVIRQPEKKMEEQDAQPPEKKAAVSELWQQEGRIGTAPDAQPEKKIEKSEKEMEPSGTTVRAEEKSPEKGEKAESADGRAAGQANKKQEKEKNFEKMWAHMQEEYMRLEPFEDGGIVEGIKISPSDIPYLQECSWNLGNNCFLLHGYRSYRHLLLGRLEGQKHYVLGVPGVYDQQEQFMAKLFGFPQFKPIRQCRSRVGQFGYWLRCIR